MKDPHFNLNVLVSYTVDKDLSKQELIKYFVETYLGKYIDLISPPEVKQSESIIIAFGEQIILEVRGLFDIFNIKIFPRRIDIFGQIKNSDNINKENIYAMYKILDKLITNINTNVNRLGNVIFFDGNIKKELLHKVVSFFCKEEDLLEFSVRKTKRVENLYNLVISLNAIEFIKIPENVPEKNIRKFNLAIDINTVPWKSEEIKLNLDLHRDKIIDLLLKEFNKLKELEVLQ